MIFRQKWLNSDWCCLSVSFGKNSCSFEGSWVTEVYRSFHDGLHDFVVQEDMHEDFFGVVEVDVSQELW